MATMIDASGKVRRFDDIDKIKWVDRNGEVLFETDYGDTVTYEQGGETKTKKLTETRRLLQFMDGFAAGDYSYMPTKIGDVFQGISLEMMTDSALYTVGKGAAVLTFGAVGGLIGSAGGPAGTAAGAGLGASFGAWLANAGVDIYKFALAYNEEPNTFWNRYVSSIKDIARGADSNLEPNATGWRRVLSEINVGTSYIGMGGKAAVYETWDDIVGTPEIGYVAANIFGNVTRAICAGVGGTMSYVVDQGLNDALREGTRIVGITNDVALAAEVGAMYGLVAGGTAWGFNKLNLANKFGFEKLEKVSPFLGNPLANGIDATSAQLLYDFIQDRIDPTEAPKDISDYGLNAAMALVTGWSMSALPVMWSKIKPKQLADATKNIDAPKPSDTPTVREAVESKVFVDDRGVDPLTHEQLTKEEYQARKSLKRFETRVGKENVSELFLRPDLVSMGEEGKRFKIIRNGETETFSEFDWLRKQQDDYQRNFFIATELLNDEQQRMAKKSELGKLLYTIDQIKGNKAKREAEIAAYAERMAKGRKYKAEYKAEKGAERIAARKAEEMKAKVAELKKALPILEARDYAAGAEERAARLALEQERPIRTKDFENYRDWYSEYMRDREKTILRELGYKALGEEEFVNPAYMEIKKDAMSAAFAELSSTERNNFAERLGFNSFDEFLYKTPVIDLMEWNDKIIKIYDIPVYNPALSLSPQQKLNIKQDAIKLINNGMQPETAVYQSFSKWVKRAPDRAQVNAFMNEMPSNIRFLSDNLEKQNAVIDFIDTRARAYIKGEGGFDYKRPPESFFFKGYEGLEEEIKSARTIQGVPHKEPAKPKEAKPSKISKTDMDDVLHTDTIIKDGMLISANGDLAMRNKKGWTYDESVKARQTAAIEGSEETLTKNYQEVLDKATESAVENVEKKDIMKTANSTLQVFLVNGKEKYVRKKRWDFVEKKFGKDLKLWTSNVEPDALFFSNGELVGMVKFDTKRAANAKKK